MSVEAHNVEHNIKPYDHTQDMVHLACGISESAFNEMDDIIERYYKSSKCNSEVMETIENHHSWTLRQKMLAVFRMCEATRGSRGLGDILRGMSPEMED